MWTRPVAAAILSGLPWSLWANDAPLSAIDWLSEIATVPVPQAAALVPLPEPSLPGEAIEVVPLKGPNLDAVGLWSARRSGLPADLWGASQVADLSALFRDDRSRSLPAIRGLVKRLALAELTPPADSRGDGALLEARIDALIAMGALPDGSALLERAGPLSPPLFRRAFDMALLTGEESAACAKLERAPGLTPDLPTRVFCLARGGDWPAAALSLDTGEVLGAISQETALLMAHFLDPALTELDGPPPVPHRPQPLLFRVSEAIGEPLPTHTRPLAFAHADLRRSAGWRAQVEAAERLARAGALSENRLIALYTARAPSASGGIWDRVAAIQAFDAAIGAQDAAEVARTLSTAWFAMRAVSLEVPFAQLYGAALQRLDLPPEEAELAYEIGLLSTDYEHIARTHGRGMDPFLTGLARGAWDGVRARTATEEVIFGAFADSAPPERFERALAENRMGEALLEAAALFDQGAEGDLAKLGDALRLFRIAGLEDTARQAALQLLLIERPT